MFFYFPFIFPDKIHKKSKPFGLLVSTVPTYSIFLL